MHAEFSFYLSYISDNESIPAWSVKTQSQAFIMVSFDAKVKPITWNLERYPALGTYMQPSSSWSHHVRLKPMA